MNFFPNQDPTLCNWLDSYFFNDGYSSSGRDPFSSVDPSINPYTDARWCRRSDLSR